MPSVTQPTPSIAAPSDGPSVDPAILLATGLHVAARGIYGLVWLDEALIARTRFGPVVEDVAVGSPITDSVTPLLGLEDDIQALRSKQGAVLELPAVAVMSADGSARRLNYTVFWIDSARRFLLLVSRAAPRAEFEVELTRQVRARLMAEAEVQAKSQELAHANTELAIANRELEQYASIISHDLKSPLRVLRQLADDAGRGLDQGDTDGAREALERVGEQTRRMSRMMTALLEYASAGRKAEHVGPVDTRTLVKSVSRSLPARDQFAIEITGDWPVMDTLEAPLDLVLRNLLDNAIKHHDRHAGRIRIDGSVRPPWLEFRIADDGPGIPENCRDVVFLPFRSLSDTKDSTGMGLAIVRRTLEASGGEIEIIGSGLDGRGTTILVRWPLSANQG